MGQKPRSQDPSLGWNALTHDLLVEIMVTYLDRDATTALRMSHVCRDWRSSILNDHFLLETLKYKTLRALPCADGTRNSAEPGDDMPSVPAILNRSLLLSNATAHVAQAKFYTKRGDKSLALLSWKTAAKKNHPLGLFYFGMHQYESFDPEDAYLYLKRACKQLMVDSGEEAFMMTFDERQELLRRASLILGIIICDNDLELKNFGLDKDYSGAIAWLKVARDRGCNDATKILNSLFRNGNY